jgi:hypothetical protein
MKNLIQRRPRSLNKMRNLIAVDLHHLPTSSCLDRRRRRVKLHLMVIDRIIRMPMIRRSNFPHIMTDTLMVPLQAVLNPLLVSIFPRKLIIISPTPFMNQAPPLRLIFNLSQVVMLSNLSCILRINSPPTKRNCLGHHLLPNHLRINNVYGLLFFAL